MRISPILTALALTLVTACLPAQIEDRDNRNLTPAFWLYNATLTTVINTVNAGNRIIDFELASLSPRRYTISYVPNAGTYRKTWWYYVDQTVSQVSSRLQSNNARLTDIEPYETSSGLRFLVLMESNTGSNRQTFWWYINQSVSSLSQRAASLNARITDLEYYTLGSTGYYAAILVSNTGSFRRTWWWYINQTAASVSSRLATNNARLWDIQRRSNGNFDIVMVRRTGEYAWWYYNQTASQVLTLQRQLGARLTDIEQRGSRFNVLLSSNVNAATNRTRDAMIGRSDGIRGFYLRRVPNTGSGFDLAGIHQDTRFEPASALKLLHLIQAMRSVSLGAISLTSTINVSTRTTSTNSCPTPWIISRQALRTVLQNMMRVSSNSATRAITDNFGGFTGLNSRVSALGLSNTRVNHHIGCGLPANYTTLRDLGQMHERIIKGYLGNQRENFNSIFNSSFYGANSAYAGGRLTRVIDEEATRAGLTSTQKTSFINAMRVLSKGGSYGVNSRFYLTWFAYVKIPYWVNSGPNYREYVCGAFNAQATNLSRSVEAAEVGAAEVLREEIRAAMATLRNHVFGSVARFGSSCGSPAFEHRISGVPEIGQSVTFRVESSRTTSHQASMEIGTSNISWNGARLPLHLDFMGARGCYWRTNSVLNVFVPIINGDATLPVTLPIDKSLIGQRLYTQFVIRARDNSAGLVTTNGLQITVGGQR